MIRKEHLSDLLPRSPSASGRLSRLAWVPVTVLATIIAVLWAIEVQISWTVPFLGLFLIYGGAALGIGIGVVAGRGFLANRQPAILMLGCGVLLAEIGAALAPAGMVYGSTDTGFAIYSLSILLAGLTHLAGAAFTRPKVRVRHPLAWLGAAYAATVSIMGLVVWLALKGWMPVFFVDGRGSTPLRDVVVGAAAGILLLTAGLLWRMNRTAASLFLYWYAFGLLLWAVGLAGSLMVVIQDSPIQWAARFTQFLALAYLGGAALALGRTGQAKGMALTGPEEAWRKNKLLLGLRRQSGMGWALRYGLAIVAVAVGFGLRQAATIWVGPGLPPYITFFPVIMVIGLVAGFGPGLVATALSGVLVTFWILPPLGEFILTSHIDRLGLVIFIGMGVLMSAVAELYRRYRKTAAFFDREAALVESQARLAAFAESTFEGIFESEDDRLLDCNVQFARMLGYSTAELKGMDRASLIAPEDRDRVMAEIRGGGGLTSEHALLRKDGTRIVVEARSRPVLPGGARRHTAVRDVTERKRIEEQIRATLESIGDGFFACDADWRFVYVNAPAERLLGIHRDDVLGRNYWDIFPLTVGTALEREYRRAAAGEARDFEDFVMPWERWFHNRCFPREGGGMSVYFDDVTDRRNAEEALKRRTAELQQLTETLEQRVKERAEELRQAYENLQRETEERLRAEMELRQSQKMEAIGALAGGIAHDFNNILAPIIINSELALLDLEEDTSLRNSLQLIYKSGLRGKDLVSQLLLFGRKTEQAQQVVALGPVIRETFKLLRSSIPATIQMGLRFETDSDTVYAVPSQIQQVVLNLCTNAAYSMRGTTGSIDFSLQSATLGPADLPEPDMQPGDYLVLSVKDSGSGMDDELKKHIFEPFFTTKPVGEGTGLGLSVVYGIVKGHKGGIAVYSEPGRGSIFRVYLPKAEGGKPASPEPLASVPKGDERILLIDDEELIVKSIQSMLERLGYRVEAVSDVRRALEVFTQDPAQFDLVITDQTMPSMTGEALGRKFMELRPDIPLILCTGYNDLITPEKSLKEGFRGFIMKPFTLREGAELIRRVLDQEGPNPPGETRKSGDTV